MVSFLLILIYHLKITIPFSLSYAMYICKPYIIYCDFENKHIPILILILKCPYRQNTPTDIHARPQGAHTDNGPLQTWLSTSYAGKEPHRHTGSP